MLIGGRMTENLSDVRGKVLLVDDDPDALEELNEILELEDIDTATAGTIDEAYASLGSDQRISVVVTDVHLTAPCGMATNGIDFVALAGRRFPDRELSFVVLSGDADAVARSFETGAVDFLTKPLVPDALISAVQRAFAGQEEASDVSSALLRKIEETTKSLQQANAELADRERRLSISQEAYERQRLQGSKLKRAIVEGHIQPWFQPQICLRTGDVTGMEALVRWIDPAHGPRPPSEFLPLAEEMGLMPELDASVAHQAFKAMARFHRLGLNPCVIGINVTGAQLSAPDFADSLALDLESAGLTPQSVAVEVLESTMLSDDPDDPVKTNVNRLAEIGVGIELDDFGTGRAALSTLRDLEVSRLKIDRSFVQDIHNDPKLQMFTRALIGLAKALEIEVLAEGVETDAELSWLTAEGCDAAQGFLIARPMPVEEIMDWARAWRRRPRLAAGATAA